MKKLEVVSLATLDKDQPRVRIMALISHDNKFWCCTITSRPKMKQFKKNSNFEFCSIIKKKGKFGSIRASGNAKIIEDLEIKKDVSKAISFFKGYWSDYADPQFSLIHLDISKIKVHSPYDKQFYTFNL
jgi:uncharacterized pyridoxamine 5'-phosphate oxidase family protein